MDDAAFIKMMKLMGEEVVRDEPGWWWLSFATDEGFRGAMLFWAPGFRCAMTLAELSRRNPGGQVQGVELPRGTPETDEVMGRYKNRLLTAEECAAFDAEAESSMGSRELN